MNTILQEAVVSLPPLPEERQAELCEMLLSAAMPTIEYTEEQIASIEAGIADADAGRFADPKEIAVLLNR